MNESRKTSWPQCYQRLFCLLLFCSITVCSQAQTVASDVSGVLKSQALGTTLSNADITLKSTLSDLTFETTTGSDGTFTARQVSPGIYDIWVQLVDRVPVKVATVTITSGKSQTIALSVDEVGIPLSFRPGVLIDADHLPDSDLAAVVRSIGQLIPLEKWRKVPVKERQTLKSIVNRQYHYDESWPETRDVVISLIANANNLETGADAFVPAGSQVLLPPLPVRPLENKASAELTQAVLPISGSVFTAYADSIGSGVSEKGAVHEDLTMARTWNLDLSASELVEFVAHIPQAIRDRLFHNSEVLIASGLQEISLHLLAQSSDAVPQAPGSIGTWRLPDSVRPTGKYYLLDVYKRKTDGCSHGEMVLDVARQGLKNYGADGFASSLVPVELDFYSDPAQGRVYIEKYARTLPPDNRAVVLSWLRQLEQKAKQPQGDTLLVPVLYLQAINQQLLKQGDADVVSTSFWTQADGHKWLPDDYDSSSLTVILGAVLNNDDSYIESKIYEKIEPLRTFLYGQTRLGVILVGAEKNPGQRFGMASKDGTGVTCVGKGFGWGSPQSCVSRNGGTSFATPHIGILMMLAEAYWKAQTTLHIDALEARVRLLLASDVVPGYVGLYASGGIPAPERLIRNGGSFLIRTSGELEDVTVAPGSSITYVDNGQRTQRLFRRGRAADFSGIQIVDGAVFIFTETGMKWEKVTDPAMNLRVRDPKGHDSLFISIADFNRRYKGAITLE